MAAGTFVPGETAMSQPSSEPTLTVGVLKETTPGEQRVAVVPESVPALARAGVRVLVEPGAGAAAWFPDGAYERAGATVASRDDVIGGPPCSWASARRHRN
jgi:NAD(P) transhydrogenase subunit alpha